MTSTIMGTVGCFNWWRTWWSIGHIVAVPFMSIIYTIVKEEVNKGKGTKDMIKQIQRKILRNSQRYFFK